MIPFVPLAVLGFGLVNKYVDGTLGLVLSFVCLFLNGVGVDDPPLYRRLMIIIKTEMSFGPVAAYLVIAFSECRKFAANTFVLFFCFADGWNSRLSVLASSLRSVLVAMAVSVTLPMINVYSRNECIVCGTCLDLLWVCGGRLKSEYAESILMACYASSSSMVIR